MSDLPWKVCFLCCGREWLSPQFFATSEAADTRRWAYMGIHMPGHDRVAILSRVERP